MKKIIIAMAAIAAAFTMASCNKEQPVSPIENPTVGKSVITASIENDLTKAYLDANGNDTDGYKVLWSEGDKLVVFDFDEYWGAEYTLDKSSVGSSKGTFIWQDGDYFITEDEYDKPIFEKDHTYEATYPSEIFLESIWKTEQTYTDMFIPMYGEAKCSEDEEADFTFTNLGGLLRLNVKGTATIKSIKVQAQEPMSGHILYFGEDDKGYKVAFISDYAVLFTPNTKNYINLNCGENGVKLRPEGTDFYISMPCRYNAKGEDMADFDGYSDVTITLTDTDGKTCVKKLNNKKLFIERSKITTATFIASEFKANVPEGALPGKFSVSADKQVYFSKGNLWADDFDLLHFEDNQWDSDNSYSLDHTSYFTWSSSVSLAAGPTGYGSNLFCDENHKVSVNGSSAPIYYALTKDEWKYLFRIDDSDRNVREMKYGSPTHSCNIIYCGTGGLVIYPDDYNGDPLSQYIEYTEETFPEGCVFLPGAGWRDDYTIREADHSIGFYWSSSADFEHRPYNVLFYMDGVSISDPGNKDNAFSIRLVANCE